MRLSKNRLAFIASLNLPDQTYLKVIDIWTKYETEIQDSLKNHGKVYTLGRYKDSYQYLRNYLLNLPLQPLPFCKVDTRGIPKTLWSLRPLIKGDRDSKRVALTIARSFEQIRLEIDYSTKSITDELTPKQEKTVRNLTKKFNRFLNRFTHTRKWYLGHLADPIDPWSKVWCSLGKGPNGPSVATSHLDAWAVRANTKLYLSLVKLNRALGQDWISEWLVQQSNSFKPEGPYLTGRLGFSSEPAGKTRIFAIGDYWSQLSLRPIQDALTRTLSNISTDATRNQDKGFKTLIKESRGHPTYCFDLSSASDRIPAVMQKHRLKLMGGKDLADSWYRVMTERNFYVKHTKENIRWAVGQPLGLLSSFPSFSLWHHDIIQFAANWKNIHSGKPLRFFKQYRLLGDDVVIFNTEVARRYQWLLKQIGLEINLSKSVIGDEGQSQIEFTKRLALNGLEMSSLKHNILAKDNEIYMLDLIDLLRERDFISSDTSHYGLHRVLKSEDLLRLSFISWLRNSESPKFVYEHGSLSLSLDRDEVIQRITEKRTMEIIKKASQIKPLDMEESFSVLVNKFKRLGVPCSDRVLADRSIGNLSGSHPIVLALTQTSRELQFLMFTVLDDLEPDTVSPVEYLPTVSEKSYFHNRTTVNVYLSKILLEVLYDFLDERKSINM